MQVQAFAMSISAVVDGENGKPIELVQHTTKRHKGPQYTPPRVVLLPLPVNTALHNGIGLADLMGTDSPSLFDPNVTQISSQPKTEHTFNRIQFKQATANNGKPSNGQQYCHIMVDLYVDLGAQLGEHRWAKIARRVSAQLVIRGRSPGYYHAEGKKQRKCGI